MISTHSSYSRLKRKVRKLNSKIMQLTETNKNQLNEIAGLKRRLDIYEGLDVIYPPVDDINIHDS